VRSTTNVFSTVEERHIQRRVKPLKSARASAPVVAFCDYGEFFRNLAGFANRVSATPGFSSAVEHTGSSLHFFLLINRFFFGLGLRVRLFCGVVCSGCAFHPYVCETCA